jgi:hypothetical protein
VTAALVNYTPNPELTIKAAAKVSVFQSTTQELWHKLSLNLNVTASAIAMNKKIAGLT